jgi:hypothetical protein
MPHFDENCLTNLNYPSSNGDDFSELDGVYNMTFSLGGGKVVPQWPSMDGARSDLS